MFFPASRPCSRFTNGSLLLPRHLWRSLAETACSLARCALGWPGCDRKESSLSSSRSGGREASARLCPSSDQPPPGKWHDPSTLRLSNCSLVARSLLRFWHSSIYPLWLQALAHRFIHTNEERSINRSPRMMFLASMLCDLTTFLVLTQADYRRASRLLFWCRVNSGLMHALLLEVISLHNPWAVQVQEDRYSALSGATRCAYRWIVLLGSKDRPDQSD